MLRDAPDSLDPVATGTVRNFVVTGCARSGTGYTATLLSTLGVPCTHEALFSPYTQHFDGFPEPGGDSSWLAVPFLGELPPGTVVLHQVRRPDAVVSSLLGIRFFADDGTKASRDWRSRLQVARARGFGELAARLMTSDGRARARRRRSDFVGFLRTHCPEIFAEPDELTRAARYWVEWNGLAARAAERDDLVYLRYRLEDLDARQTASLLRAVGREVDGAAIDAAIARLPNNANTRPVAGRAPSSSDVALGDIRGVADLAEQFGYEVERST
jgi:hypothetical protein